MHEKHFDVVIVGLGPTGACLTNLLAQCGLQVLVIDRETSPYPLPRAVHFDDETMRVFQTIGIGDDLQQYVRVNPGMRFVDSEGNTLIDWPRPSTITPQGWHASYRLHQPDLEMLLREQLHRYNNVSVWPGVELVNVEHGSANVTLHCRQRDNEKPFSVSAAYAVGCDGAGSVVRQHMSSGWVDYGYNERWLVIDVVLKKNKPELGDFTLQFCDNESPMTYCRNPGMRRRWEMSIGHLGLTATAEKDMTEPAAVWSLLSRWITPADADLERAALYTFRSAVVDCWRDGRLLLCGDAAHLTPPFMGQGMCAGVRDASNLAWKLALCVKQAGNDVLLDSYGLERGPHVTEFVSKAIALGKTINAIDISPATVPMKSLLPRLGTNEKPLFDAPVTEHTGTLFDQPTLANGLRLDDATGYNWALLTQKNAHFNGKQNCCVVELSAIDNPRVAKSLSALNTEAVLIRPDRYVLSTAKNADEVQLLRTIMLPSPVG